MYVGIYKLFLSLSFFFALVAKIKKNAQLQRFIPTKKNFHWG